MDNPEPKSKNPLKIRACLPLKYGSPPFRSLTLPAGHVGFGRSILPIDQKEDITLRTLRLCGEKV